MAKKIGVWMMGLFVLFFTAINLYNFFNKDNPNSATGFFVAEMPLGLNFSVLAFIIQWVILLVIVIFAYMKFLKHRKEEEAKIVGFVVPQLKSKAQTQLDIFYKLIQDKKSLSIGTVAKAFKIPKEKDLDWARILEEHELVTLEYPAFSDAEVKIMGYNEREEKKKMEEMKKAKEQKIIKPEGKQMIQKQNVENQKKPENPELKKPENKSIEQNTMTGKIQEIKNKMQKSHEEQKNVNEKMQSSEEKQELKKPENLMKKE